MAEKENRYIKLSRQDVSAGIEAKGGLSYLSWAYCWNLVSEHDPEANFYFTDPVWYPDESVMVKAVVTIDSKTMEQTLPVMDNRNRSIKNPDSRAISDSQQRALVKACALFGVGISLYLGEGLKQVVSQSNYEKAEELLTAQDASGFHQFVHKALSEQERVDTFNDAPAGRKSAFKAEWRALLKVADSFLEEVAAAIADATSAEDVSLLKETIEELSTYERQAVWGRLPAAEQEFVKQARSAA
jgi:hypothetical protein